MISVQTEPTPLWKELNRQIIPGKQENISEDTGGNVLSRADCPGTSYWVEGNETRVRKKGNELLKETGTNGNTMALTLHMKGDEFTSEESEIRITVKQEDDDLINEGSNIFPPHVTGNEMQPSGVEMSISHDALTCVPPSVSVVDEDLSSPLDRPQQSTCNVTESMAYICSEFMSRIEKLQNTNGLAINNGYDFDSSKNSVTTAEELERTYACEKSFRSNCRKTSGSSWKRLNMVCTGAEPSQCQFDDETFTMQRKCKQHEMIHTDEKALKCLFCQKSFTTRYNCRRHEKTHAGTKLFDCLLCSQSVSWEELERHNMCDNMLTYQFCEKCCLEHRCKEQEQSGQTCGKRFICQYCGKLFTTSYNCQKHEKLHTDRKITDCQVDSQSVTFEDLKNKQKGQTYGKCFICQYCGKSLSSRAICKTHEMIHTSEKPFKCQFCNKMFTAKYRCKIHERIHTGEKPIKCQFCTKAFSNIGSCKKHERLHTGERPYKCRFCEKTFRSKDSCKRHEKVHTGEKPFKCQFCGKTFTTLNDSKRHEKIHTGEKPYSCRFCDKTFILKDTCKRHEKVHTGVKPYKCQFCGKCFFMKGICNTHEKTHLGGPLTPLNKCQYCGKVFKLKGSCKRHEMIHVGQKPFRCRFCDKSFTVKYSRKRHELLHTCDKSRKCK